MASSMTRCLSERSSRHLPVLPSLSLCLLLPVDFCCHCSRFRSSVLPDPLHCISHFLSTHHRPSIRTAPCPSVFARHHLALARLGRSRTAQTPMSVRYSNAPCITGIILSHPFVVAIIDGRVDDSRPPRTGRAVKRLLSSWTAAFMSGKKTRECISGAGKTRRLAPRRKPWRGRYIRARG